MIPELYSSMQLSIMLKDRRNQEIRKSTGLSLTTIGYIRKGTGRNISEDVLKKLTEYFNGSAG